MDMDKPSPPIRIEMDIPQQKTGKSKVNGIACTKCSGLDQENTVLKRKIDEKDGLIRLLCKEIERRDGILDMSRKPIDEADVTVTFSEEGHPIYELKNKEKIPYTIKTEKLVPIILENLLDSCLDKETTEKDKSSCSNCKRANETLVEEQQPSAKKARLEPQLSTKNVKFEGEINIDESTKNQLVQNETGEKNSAQSGSAENQSNSNKSNDSQSNSNKSIEKQSVPRQSNSRKSNESQTNPRKSNENPSHQKESTENQDSRRKSTENQSKKPEPTTSQSTSPYQNESSVNFKSGFSEIQDLSDCPIAQKFWSGDESSETVSVTKWVIRLHDDRRVLEPQEQIQKFSIFEKRANFPFPRKSREPFYQVRRKIESLPNKKLWLDVRSFDIFAQGFHDFFSSVGPFTTHLSIGHHLHEKREINLNILLHFILNRMPNLEYLSINNNCLSSRWNFECSNEYEYESDLYTTSRFETLEKLTTLRLIYSNYTISAPQQFIIDILRKAPKLKHVYGLPLDLVNDKFEFIDSFKHVQFHSVFPLRSLYSSFINSNSNLNQPLVRFFDKDLSRLSRIDGLALETLDCRSYFIRDATTRSYCIQDFSKIIYMCRNSLVKLTLDPISTLNKEVLFLPYLPKLTELQLDLSKRTHPELWTFFEPDFRISREFPKLASVELYVDFTTAQQVLQSSRVYIDIHRNYVRPESSSPSPDTVAFHMFKKHFPPSSFVHKRPFENVENLVLKNFTPPECIREISLVFQNIQTLRLCNNIDDISAALPHCFHFFHKITNLIVEVDTEKKSRNLDSVITGIHPNMCRDLEKGGFHTPDKIQNIIRNNRSRNSICDLKNLKFLKIIIRSNSSGQVCQVPIISQVSFTYGLELMKNNVQVEIDFEERMTSDDRKYIMNNLEPLLTKIKINY